VARQLAKWSARWPEKGWATLRPELVAPEARAGFAAGLATARRWAQDFDPRRPVNLALAGGIGSGKTTAALCVARELLLAGRSVAFVPVDKLIRTITAAFDSKDGSGEALRAHLGEVEVAILDDLGAERVSDFARAEIASVIATRYDAALATVITTNCGWRDLEERLDPRSCSRLRESLVVADWRAVPDFRERNLR
jgi:DNA replication protein DnaC